MATITQGAGFGTISGRAGNAVFARTMGGTVLRERPGYLPPRTTAQDAHAWRMKIVHTLWEALTDEEFEAWQAYALAQMVRNPQTGGLRKPSPYNLFTGLGIKYLQVHGGHAVPTLPPTGRFLGDLLTPTVSGAPEALVLHADGSNAPGVLTELLAQRLVRARNAPKTKSYISQGFYRFENGAPIAVPVPSQWTYACAIRFVEAATGRMTEMYPIGRATVA